MYFRFDRFPDKITIYRRIYRIFIPLASCTTYDNCLDFLCNYSIVRGCYKTIVYDPLGPNKKMVIKYSKGCGIRTGPLVDCTYCSLTTLQTKTIYLYYLTKSLKSYEKVIFLFVSNLLMRILFNSRR